MPNPVVHSVLLLSCSTLNWEPDENGINGLVVTKTLPSEAAAALEKAMRKIAPRIMTWGQYAQAAMHYTQAYAAKVSSGRICSAPAHKYQPDFTRCADHFLLHAGGYAILRGIQKGLRLPADKMLPSFASLRDFGNTSSSSTWYTWSYIESTESVAKGQTVLQVGVGGGMKSGIAYWRALRSIKDIHPCWAHLGGTPVTEADLPRPISNDYKSIFDLPGTRTQEEQQKAIKAANAAPRVTKVAGAGEGSRAALQAAFGKQQQSPAAGQVISLHCSCT
jgi:3-ketoacyl-CoA synthase